TDAVWIRNAAASIGRELSDEEIASILERGSEVLQEQPEIRAALDHSDVSVDAHHAANMAWFHAIGLDDDLAHAIWARDGHADASFPYVDALDVMRTLKA